MKKKIKKFIRIIMIFFIIGVLAICGCFFCVKKQAEPNLYYSRGMSIIAEADYIVVPGARILLNSPGYYLKHRLNFAYDLYAAGKAPKIIISGGFNSYYAKYECEIMREYLVKLGVKEEDIISDLKGNSTYETLKRVKDYVGNKKIIFCTQEVYAYRAMYIANNLDLNMDVMCSNSVIYAEYKQTHVREMFAIIKAILNCTIMPVEVTSLQEMPFL